MAVIWLYWPWANGLTLWAGSMAGVAIADWALLYEDESETMRSFQRIMFGGTPQEKPEAHIKGSPITYAERIQLSILVIRVVTIPAALPVRCWLLKPD